MTDHDILTYEEAARLLGCHVQTVRRYVRLGQLPKAYTGRRLPDGRREKGIRRDGLHEHARILPPEAAEEARGQLPVQGAVPASSETATVPVPGTVPVAPVAALQLGLFQNHLPRPAHLPDHIPITRDGLPDLVTLRQLGLTGEVDAYEERFRAVSRARVLLSEAEYGAKSSVWQRVATEFNVGRRTLQRWVKAVDAYGWAGLMRAYGKSRGVFRTIPDELQKMILDAYAYQGQLTVAQIFTDVVKPYCTNDGRRLPHVRTIARFVRLRMPPMLKTISREGKRAFEQEHVVRVTRDPETAGINGWWCSDHRLADTMVMVPDGKGTGWPSKVKNALCTCGSGNLRKDCCSVRRLWWTVTADVCSAAFVAWRFSLQPTAATVCHMLHDAIMHFGLPQNWLRDNGREFKAKRLSGPTLNLARPKSRDLQGHRRWPMVLPRDVEASTVWELLGVNVVTAIPYSAWSKPIEALFSAFSKLYENRMYGWCGRSTKHKPEKLKDELLRGKLLTVEEYIAAMEKMITRWNTERCVGARKKTPAEYYKSYIPRRPDPQTLTFLLQDELTVKVDQGSLVLTHGGVKHKYVGDELACYSGLHVGVRCDREAPEWIWIYPGDGRCLAVQECPPAQWGAWSESNERVARARRAQRDYIRSWAADIKGACPPALLDPYGALRAVQTRLANLPAKPQEPTLPPEQQHALEEAKAAPDEKPELTIYQTDPEIQRLKELERKLAE